jgi:predicted phosphodiesterase
VTNLLYILAAWMLLSSDQPALSAANLPSGATAVFRFWSPSCSRHFYTLDEVEKTQFQTRYASTWTCEGPVFRAFRTRSDERLAPVHRFWSGLLNTHFYTVDEQEAYGLILNRSDVWTYEGIVFYAYPAGRQPAGTVPVHRFWSGSLGTHFYTIDDRERFSMVSEQTDVWQYEGPACYVYPPADPCTARIVKGPALEWVTPDSVTILWETDVPVDSRIGYGVESVDERDVEDPAFVTLHRVVLSGLAPDTRYVYRAASGPASREGAFTTAAPPDRAFRFDVFSDTQWDPQTCAKIVRNILGDQPRLVFHAGDLVSAGRNLAPWDTEFFGPAAVLLANVPLIPVPGNHSYFGGEGPWFFYYFGRPVSQAWFSLTYGAVRFVGIDTSVPFSAGSPQHDWLLKEFASPAYGDAIWRVVVLHEPPFTSTTGHGDNLAVQEQLVPLFEQYGVDAVFSGHSHAYERYLNHGITYIVTGGGGGPLYPLAPDANPPIRKFGLSVHHHCSVDVDPAAGRLTIAAVDANDRVFDLVRLRK